MDTAQTGCLDYRWAPNPARCAQATRLPCCRPTVRDQAIVYDDIAPSTTCRVDGPTSRMAGIIVSSVEMTKRCRYTVGPHSWKKFLHPPLLRLWSAEHDGQGVRVVAEPDPDERFAFIGVRSCELHAIAIQDKVFLGGAHVDPHYRARRQDAFIIAVNCGQAGERAFAYR